MTEGAKIWYENYIRDRNWILNNVLDRIGINDLNVIQGLNNKALIAINANQFWNEVLIKYDTAGATDASIILNGT